MVIDGKAIAAEILARTKARAEKLVRPPKVIALVGPPAGGEIPSTKSYLKIKAARATDAGCDFETRPLGADYADADAVIIQLPLPESVDTQTALNAIPIEKDADILSRAARERFENDEPGALLPPVVAAVREIFSRNAVEIEGKKAVVVGAGFLVGAPVATWLRQHCAQVEAFTIESTPEELIAALRAADIVISGAGSPHLIKPEMLKDGVVLIDAGTSEDVGSASRRIVGDADPACAPKCALFTPVPGGIGPIAVACLFENVVKLLEPKS